VPSSAGEREDALAVMRYHLDRLFDASETDGSG
jgi:hypothetical protein